MAGIVGGGASPAGERPTVAAQRAGGGRNPAVGVGLPDLQQRIGNRVAFPVRDDAVELDRAGRAGRYELIAAVERQRLAVERSDSLPWSGGQQCGHQCSAPSSTGVRLDPVSTMSHR